MHKSMIQHIRTLTMLVPALLLLLVTACSTEALDDVRPTPVEPVGDSVTVRLALTAAPMAIPSDASAAKPYRGVTRAGSFSDPNATADEMIKSWVVIAVKDSKVAQIKFSTGDGSLEYHKNALENGLERDTVEFRLQTGATSFYAFANMSPAQLRAIGVYKDDNNTPLAIGDVVPAFANTAIAVAGNQKDVSAINKVGVINYGIPMSSSPDDVDITINDNFKTYVLNLVRMVAKVRVDVTNKTNEELVTDFFQLGDFSAGTNVPALTGNRTDGKTNLMVLPGDKPANNQRALKLYGTPDKETDWNIYYFSSDNKTPARNAVTGVDGKKSFTFYVNESQYDSNLGFELYIWNYDKSISKIYSFDPSWTRIARNELHVLPITLDRYQPSFTVEAFTAIGVTPTVTMRNDIADIDLGTYGAFHIKPVVKDWTTGKQVQLTNVEVVRDSVRYNDENYWSGWDKQEGQSYKDNDKKPTAQWYDIAKTSVIELSCGNYDGTATFVMKYNVKGDGTTEHEARFRVKCHKIDFSDPDWAKKFRR